MAGTVLAGHPPWRQLLIISVALPVVIVLAVLAFAWPSARIAPRDVPVGIVGTGASSQRVVSALTHGEPGAFDLRLYASATDARSAIEHRDVYGAFVVTASSITVLTASAASPSVAQLLTEVGQTLGREPLARMESVDVVPTSAADPRGAVLSSALLPMTICSVIIAAVIAVLLGLRPPWRQGVALVVVSSVAGLGSYLIAQGFLGALPNAPVATWAALSLIVLAVSATTAGLVALVGPSGLGVSAVLMVFMGNPFSGVTSAPELLPQGVGRLGQWLPPGAGASLLRGTAYFDGHGAGTHLAVLLLWSIGGLAAVFVGHHTFIGFAARRDRDAAPPHGAHEAEASVQPPRLLSASS